MVQQSSRQKDDLSLQHQIHIPQESVYSGQHLERQSDLQRRGHTIETDDNGNVKFVVEMEERVEEKMIGCIPSSLRSSVDNAVNFSSANAFFSDASQLPVSASSSSAVESAKTKSQGGTSVSARNGDMKLLPERSDLARSAGSMRKSSSFPSPHVQLVSSSVQTRLSSNRDPSGVADGPTEAVAVLVQNRSMSRSVSDGKSQSEVIVQKLRPPAIKVNAKIASEDAEESASHSSARNVAGITTKSNVHRLRRTRNIASTEASDSKRLTNSGTRNAMNETVVVENSQPTTSVSSSGVKPSCESRVDDKSNQTGTNVQSSKSAQSRKPVSGIPESKYGSSKLSTSRIPGGSRKRENPSKICGNPFTAESSGSRRGRLSTSSSSSHISSQPTVTAATVSASDCTRLCSPKPSGMFSK